MDHFMPSPYLTCPTIWSSTVLQGWIRVCSGMTGGLQAVSVHGPSNSPGSSISHQSGQVCGQQPCRLESCRLDCVRPEAGRLRKHAPQQHGPLG